ncbi:MAG: DNA translocase FtsK [Candidatus Paceibacterota bacterium]
MAKKSQKKTKKKDTEEEEFEEEESLGLYEYIREETIQAVVAIVFFVITAFLVLAYFGNAGLVGEKAFTLLDMLLGVGYFLLPVLFILLGISFLKALRQKVAISQALGGILFIIGGLGLIQILLAGKIESPGGVIGAAITAPLLSLFELYLTVIILGATLFIALLIVFDHLISLEAVLSLPQRLFGSNDELADEGQDLGTFHLDSDVADDEMGTTLETDLPPEPPAAPAEIDSDTEDRTLSTTGELDLTPSSSFSIEYKPPPLKLLEKDRGKPGVGDIKANANVIKRTLHNFGVQVEMDEVSVGPTVTRYALKPAEGVKLSRIVALQNDLSLALAAHPLRIEAPIPGKSLVGIELPNTTKSTIGLATLLGSKAFSEPDKPLLMALGKGITGETHFGNLAKMPHVLIAGATGSGKSVTIHSLITSLLYRNSPEFMRFIMVDPKRVELTLYNSIPHLLTPVITDPKKAILSLKWAQKEMDRRYDILETEKVRDIGSYHKNVLEPALAKHKKGEAGEDDELPETMPYIVVIVDELADIMQAYPREMESAIVRLAQMSRAVGIHLVLSTQRPSVNVITGLIKANIPARIALQVASQVDSRTILDAGGAEKLLGAGDMLYLSGEMSQPSRIQSAFITEDEVKKVVTYLADQYSNELPEQIDFTGESAGSVTDVSFDEDGDDEDELFEEARELVIEMNKASTSLIQRKLKVGYARAARLMDMLEERGVVSEGEGSKPRRVLVNEEAGNFGGHNSFTDDGTYPSAPGDNGQNPQ